MITIQRQDTLKCIFISLQSPLKKGDSKKTNFSTPLSLCLRYAPTLKLWRKRKLQRHADGEGQGVRSIYICSFNSSKKPRTFFNDSTIFTLWSKSFLLSRIFFFAPSKV